MPLPAGVTAYKVNDVDYIFISSSGGGGGSSSVLTWNQSTPWSTILALIAAGVTPSSGAIVMMVDDGTSNHWVLNQASGDMRNVTFVGAAGPQNPAALHVATGWSTTGSAMNFQNVTVLADTASLASPSGAVPFYLTMEGGGLQASAAIPALLVHAAGTAFVSLTGSALIFGDGTDAVVTVGGGSTLDLLLASQSGVIGTGAITGGGTVSAEVDATCKISVGAISSTISIFIAGPSVAKVADAAHTSAYNEVFVEYTSLTAARVCTIPNAANAGGQSVTVKAPVSCSATVTINVQSAGGTLDGVAAGTGIFLTTPYCEVTFTSDGTNWISTGCSNYLAFQNVAAMGTPTTGSTTFVDIGDNVTTGFALWNVQIPVNGMYDISAMLTLFCFGGATNYSIQIAVDGTATNAPSPAQLYYLNVINVAQSQTIFQTIPLTAGAHAIKLQWLCSPGIANIEVSSICNRYMSIKKA